MRPFMHVASLCNGLLDHTAPGVCSPSICMVGYVAHRSRCLVGSRVVLVTIENEDVLDPAVKLVHDGL